MLHDDEVGVEKLESGELGGYDTGCAFAHARHPDQNDVVLYWITCFFQIRVSCEVYMDGFGGILYHLVNICFCPEISTKKVENGMPKYDILRTRLKGPS